MSCWHFRSELGGCPALLAALAAVLLLAAALPWLAGVPAVPAAALTALALASLPGALRSVPGRWCRVKALAGGPDGLRILPAGTAARPLAATRVLPGLVLLHAAAGSRRQVLWIPRAALPAGDFRRLKVAVRAGRDGVGQAA